MGADRSGRPPSATRAERHRVAQRGDAWPSLASESFGRLSAAKCGAVNRAPPLLTGGRGLRQRPRTAIERQHHLQILDRKFTAKDKVTAIGFVNDAADP